MKNKVTTYQVLAPTSGKHKHEYDLIVKETKKGTKFNLYYSDNSEWVESIRGKKIMSLTDTGNEIILGHKVEQLEYDAAFELRLLLNTISALSSNSVERMKCKLVKQDKEILV